MHFTAAQRALRLIVFSIGFVLFIVIAIRSGGQASKPQLVKGKPLLAGISHVVGVLPQAAVAGTDVGQLSADSIAETQTAANLTDTTVPQAHSSVPVAHTHAELPEGLSKVKKAAATTVPTVGRDGQL